MSNLSSAKMFGGIGAILLLAGVFVPIIGFVVTIVGLVLVYLAVKHISDETKDTSISKNYLWYLIFSIIAVISLFAIIPIVIGGLGTSILSMTDYSKFSDLNALSGMIVACAAALIVAYIFYIISAIYLRKSYNSIAEKTNVNLFKTTGLLYLIGAVTVIILIGIVIILIARILEIVSFFSLPETLSAGTPGQVNAAETGRRCPNCGRSIPEDARICPYCNKNFEQQ